MPIQLNKKTETISTGGDLANCEPSKALRDRIVTDLAIQGQRSVPQKIDMRAIIPVYSFTPPETKWTQIYSNLDLLNIGGQASPWQNIIMSPAVQIPGRIINKMRIKTLNVQLSYDAAGRAALVASGDFIIAQLTDTIAPYQIVIAQSILNPVASAGNPLFFTFGNIQNQLGINLNRYASLLNTPIPNNEWSITNSNSVLTLSFSQTQSANFPANTGVEYDLITEYY
jgi:hypothetical protein